MGFRLFVQRWVALGSARRLLLLEATRELVRAWFRVRVLPFRAVAPELGQQGLVAAQSEGTTAGLDELAWAIQAVSRRTPWKTTCLMQALATQRMLRRRRIPATVYLALLADRKEIDAPLLAHAWVRCGQHVVTGHCDESQYRVIATFA